MRIIWLGLVFTLFEVGGLRQLVAQAAQSNAPRSVIEGSAPPSLGVDLRPEFDRWGLARRRQGARPTCSVFTVVGALEFAMAKRQGQGTRLSVEFLNWASNKACSDQEDGGFFSDLWKGFDTYGICLEEVMPYRATFERDLQPNDTVIAQAKTRLDLGLRLRWIKEWNVNTGLTGEQLSAIQRTLQMGWPVCGGFRWPKQEQWIKDVLQLCPANEVRDGHSVLLVGYQNAAEYPGGGVFLFRNTAHDARDGLMPYAYAQSYMNDAVWIECDLPGRLP